MKFYEKGFALIMFIFGTAILMGGAIIWWAMSQN